MLYHSFFSLFIRFFHHTQLEHDDAAPALLILILSPRFTSDSATLRNAALLAGWDTERLHLWRLPDRLYDRDLVLYGEPLFAEVIAGQCGLALMETPFDWLACLPEQYRKRWITYSTSLAEARNISEHTFVKPVDGKSFAATIYTSGAQLPTSDVLPDDTPVLLAEPVSVGIGVSAALFSNVRLPLSLPTSVVARSQPYPTMVSGR